jgi:cyclic lactone autoinducer peptide
MKNRLKKLVAFSALAVTTLVAATSSYGCWLFTFHQRECPKCLIEMD